jgi:hypothetical protein
MQARFSTHFLGIFPVLASIITMVGFATEARAQEFTKADSGWVRLFNGTDFNGWYSRTYNVSGVDAPLVVPPAAPYSIEFAGTDTATIRVGANSPQGNIGTIDSSYSHYRFRVEAKYDTYGTTNAGLTYHTRELAIRMNNNWPRSIEFQFRQNETGDAFSIQQVTFDIRGNGATYSPTGTAQTGCEFGCNRRSFSANPRISTAATTGATSGPTRWLRYHLIARGADSATHIVQDTVVLALSNIRITNDCTKATGSTTSGSSSRSNCTPNGPHGYGALGLQAEGTTLRYRRVEMMQFPASTPKTAPYLHRLFLDAPAAPVKPAPGAQVALQWRAIGTIPKVKIEYRSGTGAWQTITDSVPNTGTHNWNAPGSVPDSLRFRISSLDYVWADSTDGTGPVSIRYGLPESGRKLFTVRGGEWILPGTAEFSRMEIRDASGRTVRALPLSGSSARWDLTGANGARVQPGLYFFRLTGSAAPLDGRVMVF